MIGQHVKKKSKGGVRPTNQIHKCWGMTVWFWVCQVLIACLSLWSYSICVCITVLSVYEHAPPWSALFPFGSVSVIESAFLTPCHLSQHISCFFSTPTPPSLPQREPVLLNELKNLKVAMRVFQWRAQVWFPSNYVVSRTFQGESELIPTVLASSPTCITTPRTDPNHPVYLLEKQVCGFTEIYIDVEITQSLWSKLGFHSLNLKEITTNSH